MRSRYSPERRALRWHGTPTKRRHRRDCARALRVLTRQIFEQVRSGRLTWDDVRWPKDHREGCNIRDYI